MLYCRKCRDEFQDWFQKCPDRNVPLTRFLPELPKPEPRKTYRPDKHAANDPVLHLLTAPNESVAIMWMGILKDNGIESFCKTDDFKAATVNPIVTVNNGAAIAALRYNVPRRIYVLASDRDKAMEILAPFVS